MSWVPAPGATAARREASIVARLVSISSRLPMQASEAGSSGVGQGAAMQWKHPLGAGELSGGEDPVEGLAR
jgi:hypothetical protein